MRFARTERKWEERTHHVRDVVNKVKAKVGENLLVAISSCLNDAFPR